MFRNLLAAALGNLARNRLYAAISIGGLAIGMVAAILTGLYIRDELTFDHFIPGYENVYVVVSDLRNPGKAPVKEAFSPLPTPSWLKEDFGGTEATAGLMQSPSTDVRSGGVDAIETIDWVDPDFFKLLPLKAVAGDPDAAIRQPDGLVITREVARKYFGRDAPLGETLELRRNLPMTVRAVIEDLPGNTHLTDQIYASSLSAGSIQRWFAPAPYRRGEFSVAGMTYVRFRSPSDAARAIVGMPGLVSRHMSLNGKWNQVGFQGGLSLMPLSRMHLAPFLGVTNTGLAPPGDPKVLAALAAVAGLVLAMAAVNFVNLSTARAVHRAVEVGVRKTAGARRSDLVVQFIGEAAIHVLLALVLAAAIVELTLPALNSFLLRDIRFEVWRDPGLLGALTALALLMAFLAGLYPALVLSSFRPASVVKGGGPSAVGSQALRVILVTLQFAVLIGLLLSTAVIVRQTGYSLEDRLKLVTSRVLVMELWGPMTQDIHQLPKPMCRGALVDEIRRLPGVEAAACSSPGALDQNRWSPDFALKNGMHISLRSVAVEGGFFELYGVRPLAGRTLVRRPADEGGLMRTPPFLVFNAPVVVLNQSGARMAGFADPAKVIGAPLYFLDNKGAHAPGSPARIVGVAPDFALDLIHGPVAPTVYFDLPQSLGLLSIKLNGQDMRGTITAIDRLWKRLGEPEAVSHHLLSDQLGALYLGIIRQEMLVSVLAGVAVVVACLGLFGMAAFTAERRTKEIGVRKAMGASTRDILGVLLWSFTQPVLWANLIAWPLGWWTMDRWLHQFSAHIPLSPWLFFAAGGAALAIAGLTVSGHALHVARAKPVGALRYE